MRLAAVAGTLAGLGAVRATTLDDMEDDDKTTTIASTAAVTSTTSTTLIVTSTRVVSADGGTARLGVTSNASTSNGTTTSTAPNTSLAATTATATVSLAPDELTSEGKEYGLQGCFAHDSTEDIGLLLGQNHTTTEASYMSLSLCLKLCASGVKGATSAGYPFVGVADGSFCYCGTDLNQKAPQCSIYACTLPCAGNDTELCGGQGHISVYKRISPEPAAPSTHPGSDDGRLASIPAAALTEMLNKHSSGAILSEKQDRNTSGAREAGVMAGIVLGSVSGFGLLLFLVFVAMKWLIRHRHTSTPGTARPLKGKAAISASRSTASDEMASTIVNTRDAASVHDAMRVDLRPLDGVTTDQHSPAARFPSAGDKKGQVDIGAATGADWKHHNETSPLTPRTPRQMNALEDEIKAQPSTPSIMVHPPEKTAPDYGLDETASHRRRLSMPLAAPVIVYGAETVDDRRVLPSQVSRGKLAGD
ncbi:unnamed protein product [Discula destructiva]